MKYQQKGILNLLFLFTSKNAVSGYTLCHIENCDAEKRNIPGKLKYRKKHHCEY